MFFGGTGRMLWCTFFGYKFISVACEHRRISRGTQGEILRKRPKNNNKAWIRLSEAILSILGDCWEKFICSSYSRSKTDGRVLNQKVAPTTCNLTNVRRGRRAKLRPSVEGGGGGVEKWVWPKGEIHPFSGGWGEARAKRRYWQIAHSSYSRLQIPSNTTNCLFSSSTASKGILFLLHLPVSKNLPEEQIF